MAQLVSGTRLTLFLPVNNSGEQWAAARVVAEVNSTYRGSTRSSFAPSTFRGYWVNTGGDILIDEISILIVDVENDADDLIFVEEILTSLKLVMLNVYEECGSPQYEAWLVAQPISRTVES